MANGQPVPIEELDLFCEIVMENSEALGDEGGRFQILREKIEAYLDKIKDMFRKKKI